MNKNLLITKIVIYSLLVVFLLSIVIFGIRGFSYGHGLYDLIYYFNDYDHNYSYNNNNFAGYNEGDATIPADNINNIYIEWTKGEVNVETHDKNTIEISETGNIYNDNKLLYTVKNNDLHIIFHKRINYYFGFRNFNDKTLTVKIPKDKNLILLDLETVSPTINIKDINTDTLDVETVSGRINIVNTNANYCDVETVSSKIDINGAFNEIDSKSVSGKTIIHSTICPNSINTNSVSGSITINIPENEGFTADFETISGKFTSQFEGTTNKNQQIYKNGKSEIDAETVSGSFTINKIQ